MGTSVPARDDTTTTRGSQMYLAFIEGLLVEGRPRESEPESPTSTDQATSGRSANEPCPFSSPAEQRGQNRSAECRRAGPSWSNRTSVLKAWPVTLHTCRRSASIPQPWSLCQYQSHDWEAGVSPCVLLRERPGIDRRW